MRASIGLQLSALNGKNVQVRVRRHVNDLVWVDAVINLRELKKYEAAEGDSICMRCRNWYPQRKVLRQGGGKTSVIDRVRLLSAKNKPINLPKSHVLSVDVAERALRYFGFSNTDFHCPNCREEFFSQVGLELVNTKIDFLVLG